MSDVAKVQVYDRPSDYVYNMTTLNSGEARRLWRAAIKEAWENKCAYCDSPPISDESLTIDHVKPRSRGGQDCTSNVIPACWKCNQAKASLDWVAWYRMQPFYSINGEWRIKEWLRTGEVKDLTSNQDDSDWYENLLNELT
jgi:hypothetical protein